MPSLSLKEVVIVVALCLAMGLAGVMFALNQTTRGYSCVETRQATSSQTGSDTERVVSIVETNRKECR